MSNDEYPQIAAMESDVNEHGEVHAIVEGHDAEIELRRDPTEFMYDEGVIAVWDGKTYHRFAMDRFVRWYTPVSIFHE